MAHSFWGDFRVYYILFFCIFLVSFLLEFCQKSFLLCVFFEWSIFRLNLVVAAYSFGGVHSFLPGCPWNEHSFPINCTHLVCILLAIRNTKQNDPDGENEDFGRVE